MKEIYMKIILPPSPAHNRALEAWQTLRNDIIRDQGVDIADGRTLSITYLLEGISHTVHVGSTEIENEDEIVAILGSVEYLVRAASDSSNNRKIVNII